MAIKASGLAYTRCVRRPGRTKKQTWTPKAVGRVACYALQAGWTTAELLDELERCAPCKERRSKRNQKRLELALQQNNGVLNDSEIVLVGLNLALDGFLLLSRFVPMLRAPGLLVAQARRPLAQVVTRIRARKAANDELYEMVLREGAA